jgi:hypothetical protein
MNEDERKATGEQTRQNFKKHYQWHISGKKWEDYFDSIEIAPMEQTWASPPKIHTPEKKPDNLPPNVNNSDLAKWLILNVLGDPSKVGTFFEARLTRDLMYKTATASTGGMYFNESSAAFDGLNVRANFSFDDAYANLLAQCEKRNSWERKRIEVVQQKGTS